MLARLLRLARLLAARRLLRREVRAAPRPLGPVDPGGRRGPGAARGQGESSSPRLRLDLSEVSVILGALTLASTGGATAALTVYYAQLGVSLEEAGVGVSRVVLVGGAAVLFLGGATTLVLAPLALAGWMRRSHPVWVWVAVVILAGVTTLSVLSLGDTLGLRVQVLTPFLVLVGLVGLVAPLVVRGLPLSVGVLAWLNLAITALVGGLVWADAYADAADAGQRLRREGAPGTDIISVLLRDTAAVVPTCAHALDGGALPRVPAETVLLGTNGDVHVVLDHDGVVHRLPSDAVALRSRAGFAAGCP